MAEYFTPFMVLFAPSWADIFGALALAFYIAMYLYQNPRATLRVECAGDAMAMVHYLLLGSIAATLLIFLTLVRIMLAISLPNHLLKPMLISYVVLIWLLACFTLNMPVELWGFIGCTCATIAALWRDHWLPFRLGLIACYSCWLVLGVFISSPALVISYVMVVGMNVLTVCYFLNWQRWRRFIHRTSICDLRP